MAEITESLRGTLLRAYLLVIISRAADVVFFFLLFSKLTVENVGIYSWTMAAAAFFGTAIEFGLSQVLVREFSKRTITLENAARASALIRLPVAAAAIIGLVVWEKTGGLPAGEYAAVALAFGVQIFLVVEGFCQSWLKATSRQNTANALTALDPLGRLAAISLFVALFPKIEVATLLAAICALHIGISIAHIIVVLNRRRAEADAAAGGPAGLNARELMFSGFAFSLIALVTVAQNRLDWLLLSFFADKTELANYALTNKIYEVFIMFIGVPMLTAFPWMCHATKTRGLRLRIDIVLNSIVVTGVTLAFATAVYFPEALTLLWRDKYDAAQPMIQLLMPVAALSSLIMVLYYQLISRGMERLIFKISVVSTAIQLAANLLLIPRWGAFGSIAGMAALATTNLVIFSALAIREGLTNRVKVARHCMFLAIMLGVALPLWITRAHIALGCPVIASAGLAGGFFLVASRRERTWVSAYGGRHVRAFFKKMQA